MAKMQSLPVMPKSEAFAMQERSELPRKTLHRFGEALVGGAECGRGLPELPTNVLQFAAEVAELVFGGPSRHLCDVRAASVPDDDAALLFKDADSFPDGVDGQVVLRGQLAVRPQLRARREFPAEDLVAKLRCQFTAA